MSDDYGWVDLGDGRTVFRRLAPREAPKRSDLAFPMVVSDIMPETTCMVDGKVYTSKAAMRRTHRARGYVEVGNEWLNNPPQPPKFEPDRKAIKDAVGKAFARVGLPTC